MDGSQISTETQASQISLEKPHAPSVEKREIKEIAAAFRNSEYQKMIEARKSTVHPSVVLFTDIDNTFYRADAKDASAELNSEASKENVPIVAITGNNYEDVLTRIEAGELPYFSVIAGSVGTEIWVLHIDAQGNKTYVKDEDFDRQLLARGYDRPAIAQLSKLLVDQSRVEHPSWQLDFQKPDVEAKYLLDESTSVEPYKTSFYMFASSPEDLAGIRTVFGERFPGQKIVVAEEINHNSTLAQGDGNKKYCIDVLPITKAGAVEYIQNQIDLDFSAIAGDSGNDADMLTGVGDVAIQVGGAKLELAQAINTAARESTTGSFTKAKRDDRSVMYYREGGSRMGPKSIFHAMKVLDRAYRRFGGKPAAQQPATDH